MIFNPSFTEPSDASGPAYCFLFQGSKLLVKMENGSASIPSFKNLQKLNIEDPGYLYLGTLNDRHCYSARLIDQTVLVPGNDFIQLRELYSVLTDVLWQTAGLALHLINWNRNSQYCSRCGQSVELKLDERAKICGSCEQIDYPRINPCIIVAVIRDDSILLARSSRFPKINLYSVLAGYVEPGETLFECTEREVKEETGIDIKNINYFDSQPWPFSSSLMIGFTAEYAGGEIKVDGQEIVDAGWYTVDNLPGVPRWGSIAGELINWFVRMVREQS